MLARALGLPVDAAAAIRRVQEVIAAGRYRTIGLGLAGDRYFTFSAGLGMDAETVREVERLRAEGRRESTPLFLRTMMRQYLPHRPAQAGADAGTRRPAADWRPVPDHHHEPLAVDLFPRPPAAARS